MSIRRMVVYIISWVIYLSHDPCNGCVDSHSQDVSTAAVAVLSTSATALKRLDLHNGAAVRDQVRPLHSPSLCSSPPSHPPSSSPFNHHPSTILLTSHALCCPTDAACALPLALHAAAPGCVALPRHGRWGGAAVRVLDLPKEPQHHRYEDKKAYNYGLCCR